ncbi:uncharacterized protein [Macrobrachium rosenbergii]|uniref:uncharacterized protein isoform X1 n=1 Tax=Macrobrachium rosenbergii TaxID=79674 RepID=UPI0034D77978
MHLVSLAVRRGGPISSALLGNHHGSILARQLQPSHQWVFYSALPLKKSRILLPIMRIGWSRCRCFIHTENTWITRADRYLKNNREVILTLTLGVFMSYFMFLRQPSDIDEYLSRPIWERVPGIDPETAEQMMEMDKNLGLQVDKTGLEEYKQRYYAGKLKEMEAEKKAEQRHELEANAGSH